MYLTKNRIEKQPFYAFILPFIQQFIQPFIKPFIQTHKYTYYNTHSNLLHKKTQIIDFLQIENEKV